MAAALSVSFSAHAAGLGRLTVLSNLGQPLRAEIEVVSLQKGEADSLQARLAPPEAYQQAGVEYAPVLSSLRFEMKQQPDGRYVIVMTSLAPVNDPFVDVLVELDWATGRLVRQFVFLLDPLEYQANKNANAPSSMSQLAAQQAGPSAAAPAQPQPAQPQPAQASEGATASTPPAEPAQAAAPRQAQQPSAQPAASQAAHTPAAAASQYHVKPGDTLARIANQVKPDNVSLEQMLVALYRSNQGAFINKNVNLLRVGKVLTIPSSESAQSIPVAEAHQVLVVQSEEWMAYRRSLAERAGRQPAQQTAAGQSAGGKISAEVQESAAPPSDRVRLGTEATGKAGAAARGDEATARDRELREMRERVAELEKNVQDMSAALRLKSEQLASLEKSAESKANAATPPSGVGAEAPPAASGAGQPASEQTPQSTSAPAAQPGADANVPKPPAAAAASGAGESTKPGEAQPPQAPGATATPPAAKPPVPAAPKAAAPKRPAPPPHPAEPSFFDDLMDDLPLIGILVAAIVALLAGMFWYRRKKTDRIDDTLMSVAGTDANSVFGTTGGRSVDTGTASSQQTDFSQSGIGAIDTDEVDPVAEADVYMAYGRDAQAEEILKEALQKDPSKHAVRAKLLEIYAARKDVKAFETTAGELYAATQGQGSEWERAAALGAQLDPSNPMYAPALASHGVDQARAEVVSTVRASASAAVEPLAAQPAQHAAPQAALQPAPGGHSLLHADLPELSVTTRAPEDLGFDLNLGDSAAKGANSRLDLELPETKIAEHSFTATGAGAAHTGPVTRAPIDFGSINLDLGPATSNGPVGADARWQEVATKLDLAKAYHEMGDRDGARELLGEVAKEGDAAQQQQAKKLLETIG